MGVEYEIKFKATEEVLSAIDRGIAGETAVFQMETTYYDTPSGALSARFYTLRRRLENGKAVCTLKAPAKQGRGEWEIPCEDILQAIPKLVAMGCPADLPDLVQEGLIPVCGAKFARIAKTLTLPEGIVELALDRGILFGGGREAPLCEAEVELKEGSVSLCDAFGKMLATEFSLKTEKKSKFRRALALYKGE